MAATLVSARRGRCRRRDSWLRSRDTAGVTSPWHRDRPPGAVDVATDDDDFVTVDRWPKDVFAPHYHDGDFNWLVPMRPGRIVVEVDGDELVLDGDTWLCVFPRTPHRVVHVSDAGEVLSLFVPDATMAAAWSHLDPQPRLDRAAIVGGEATIARGLALAWGELRFARRAADAFDDALAIYLAGWLWRHYGAPPTQTELPLQLRAGLGGDGAAVADFLERHLAEQPFPWLALAEQLGTSLRTLQRRFVTALGHAPSTALHQLRLDRARDLLRDPSRPIGDVALACGFASQAHFATAFRAAFGMSPTQARRR
jgi:AraC-like DNA-binding protein